MSGPLDGHRVHQLLVTLCVISSLTLVTLGGFDLTQQILPLNPELWQTPRQLWDPFQIQLSYPNCFASSVLTPRGYKASVATPAQPTSSHTIFHRFSTSFPMVEKKEENRETDLKKQEGVVELTGSRLSFLSVPWRSRVVPHQRLCKSTYKTS
jgi:hypothetical protein